MKTLRSRKQNNFLRVLLTVATALLFLLVLPRTTASTAPKWYQRRPQPPTPEPAREDQQDFRVTKIVPGWLQRASNRTATNSDTNEEEEETTQSPPRRGFAPFFFSSTPSNKTNETSTTITASSKKDLPQPNKADSGKKKEEKAKETAPTEEKKNSKGEESSAVTKPTENVEAATASTKPEEDEESPTKTMVPRGWFGSRSDKAPSNEQDDKADDKLSTTKEDGSAGEAAAPAATDSNAGEDTPIASDPTAPVDKSSSLEATTAKEGQVEKVADQVSVEGDSAKESSDVGDTTAPETKDEPASSETAAKEQPKQRRGWFQRRRDSKPKEPQDAETTTTTSTTDVDSAAALTRSNQTLTSTATTPTTTTDSTNQTSSESKTATPLHNQTQAQPSPETQQQQQQSMQQQQQQQQQQQPQGGIIIMGQPSGSRYYYGRGRPMYPSQQQQQQQQQPGMPINSSPLAEILGQVLGTAMRLWFLTWITKRLASQEEAMLPATQHYCWEGLNDKFQRDAQALQTAVRTPPLGVPHRRWKRLLKERKSGSSKTTVIAPSTLYSRTVVVVDLNAGGGDDGAIGLEHLADVVTFLLLQQRRRAFGTDPQTGEPLPLEVVLMVNSPGGAVSTYGLAAAQLRRLNSNDDNNIATTVCVDKYAASGGYMIASQADKLVAAPFATLGSVGVILEGLNFNELARRYGVHPLVLKAGDSKNPISSMGPISKDDLENEQQNLKKTHEAFIELVVEGRGDKLAKANFSTLLDGSVFLGNEAVQLGLVDAVRTTDEYLLERITAGDRVLRLHRSFQHRFMRRPLHISPLDILPHLRSWANRVMSRLSEGGGGDGSELKILLTRFVQAGSWVGFLHHVISKYGNHE